MLANEWQFETIREEMIKQLGAFDLSSARKIQVAHRCSIPHWYAPEILKLVERSESLSFEEADLVGLKLAMFIASAREARLSSNDESAKRVVEYCRDEGKGASLEEEDVLNSLEWDVGFCGDMAHKLKLDSPQDESTSTSYNTRTRRSSNGSETSLETLVAYPSKSEPSQSGAP